MSQRTNKQSSPGKDVKPSLTLPSRFSPYTRGFNPLGRGVPTAVTRVPVAHLRTIDNYYYLLPKSEVTVGAPWFGDVDSDRKAIGSSGDHPNTLGDSSSSSDSSGSSDLEAASDSDSDSSDLQSTQPLSPLLTSKKKGSQ